MSGEVRARAVVPCGPIPVTAKALAELTRAGTVGAAGLRHHRGAPRGLAGRRRGPLRRRPAAAAAAVRGVLEEVADHPRGPLLGACERAEAFLRTWRDDLPFGRPIA